MQKLKKRHIYEHKKKIIYKNFSNAFVIYKNKLCHKFDLKKATLLNREITYLDDNDRE